MTAVATSTGRLSPEDLLSLPDLGRYEGLIDGELQERHMSVESSHTSWETSGQVRNYLTAHPLGWGFTTDCGLQIFPWRPKLVRFSDGGFYRKSRGPRPGHGHLKIAPDLVIEVVSPGDDAEDLETKVQDYLRAGVQMIWVAFPFTRTVAVYRLNGSVTRLQASETLEGEDVLPGFSTPVASLFLPPDEDEDDADADE